MSSNNISKPLKVLFTGTYNSLDIGGMAMVLGAIRTLQNVFPDSEFSVLSSLPSLDRERYRGHGIKVIARPQYRNTIHWVLLGITSLLFCIVYTFINLHSSKANVVCKEKFVEAFCNSDIVLDLSGHSFRGAEGQPSLYITLTTLHSFVLTKTMRKPFVLFAQTIEPPFPWKCLLFLKPIIYWADAITTRDESTYAYLQKFKTRGLLYSAADLAYLTQPISSARVNTIVKCVQQPIVAVMPRNWTFEWSSSVNKQDPDCNVTFFTDLVNFLTNNFRCNVLLMPHWIGPGSLDDRPFIHRIYQSVENKDRVIVFEKQLTTGETLALIEKCSMAVSANLHPTILAASIGVPFMVLSSSNKFRAIPNGLSGTNPNFIDVRGQNMSSVMCALKSRLFEFINNLDEERQKLKEIMPDYLEASQKNGQVISYLMTRQ
jgi:colanic acid/amylovoran biosynthesis protein